MKKILIIEDDKYLIKAYRLKLEKAGFEVKIVTDGKEGLGEIDRFMPDLIVLDLILPETDGFEVLEEAKKRGVSVPILVSSNLGQEEDIEKAKKLGAVDYIVKSNLSIDSVVEKITKALNEK